MDYLPMDQRREVVRSYLKRHGLRTLIETGTAEGDTVAALLPDLDKAITIEIDPDIHRLADERFSGDHVLCLLGDSGEILQKIVPEIDEPVLFWLDGHFCGGAVKPEIDTPIRDELRAVMHAPKGSVILIDDARLFGEMPGHTEEYKDYPDISWVENTALNHKFIYKLEDDIIRLEPSV